MMQQKKIKGFEDKYEITDTGKVWSNYKKDYLKPSINKNGYYIVYLSLNHIKKKTISIHRLVASHFIENNTNKTQVNHIDGNKLNNNANNLEWTTNKENMHHAIKNNLYNPKRCGMCKEIVLLNEKTNEEEKYFSITNFAEINNYPASSVRTLLNRNKKYRHYKLL